MIRILHIVSTMDYGGVETLLMSIYRNIDREKIQFDFLCHNRLDCKFKSEIETLGGHIYMIPGPSHVGFVRYGILLQRFLKDHNEYRIIHCHLNKRNGEILYHAYKAGVPVRISHCHTAFQTHKFPMNVYFNITRKLNNEFATERMACSTDAAEYLFDEKKTCMILPNAISISQFTYDGTKRCEVRNLLEVEDQTILIGHVGRFDDDKNQRFLLELTHYCLERGLDCKLLLLGDGKLKGIIEEQAKNLRMMNKLILAGQHKELGKYYSAMDIFVFPSIFEGLGIVAVEAQCSGLPVIASTGVPKEAKVMDNMCFLSLDDPYEKWYEEIQSALNENKKRNRVDACRIVGNSMYNITKTTKYLSDLYLLKSNSIDEIN